MHGVFIEEGVQDWQIVQHLNGFATLHFSGTYIVPDAAINVGVKSSIPMIRVMSEDDNSQIITWTQTNYYPNENNINGKWDIELNVPAGGLYRIETCLDTASTNPELRWLFRGDIRCHIGVGDLFVIAGQSNSSGYGRDFAYDPPTPFVHLYRNRKSWDICTHPINESTYAADEVNAEMGVSGVSPYLAFGKSFHKLSHYPVGFITCALGGSPISRWNKSQNGDLFNNMIQRIKECGGKVSGILWYQGCSDTTPELADTYYDSFKEVVLDTRAELGYQVPFFTFQLNRQLDSEHDHYWGVVKEAQGQAATTIPNVYILPTIDCTLCDGIHNDAHSSIMLGEKMAKLCGHVLYNTPIFFAPQLAKIEYSNQILTLYFDNVQGGLLIFTKNSDSLGLLLKDKKGKVPIKSVNICKDARNAVTIVLDRPLTADASISCGWEANPTHTPIVDETTYIPIVSFYNYKIN